MRYSDVDGTMHRMTYSHRVESSFIISRDELPDLDDAHYAEKIGQLGNELAEGKTKIFFKKLDETLESAGRVIDGAGKSLEEQFLEALSSVEVEFDSEGRPQPPTIIANPAMADKLQKAAQRVQTDPALRRRVEEIMTRKYLEWRDREADRKLVD